MIPTGNPAAQALSEEELMALEAEEAALAEQEALGAPPLAEPGMDPTMPAGPEMGGDVPFDTSVDPAQQAAMIGAMIGEQAQQAHAMIDQEVARTAEILGQIILETAAQPMTLDDSMPGPEMAMGPEQQMGPGAQF
jgi:hypothetical protein